MTTLAAVDIFRAARQAGFSAAEAVRATAIALAESGGRTDAQGDVGIQTSTWGPSVGLMQIRTVKAETGRGTPRDITRLSDPVANMSAAYAISNGGRDWTPWSTYKSGSWRRYLATAQAGAAKSGSTTLATSGGGVVVEQAAFMGLPGTATLTSWATKGLFVALGLSLVGGGVWMATR